MAKIRSCGKTRYRDRIAALLALSRIAGRDPRSEKTPIRAYRCGQCSGWHLTSREGGQKNRVH